MNLLTQDFYITRPPLLKIVQARMLNRFVDDSFQLTWRERLCKLKTIWPVLIFCSVAGMETVVLAWPKDPGAYDRVLVGLIVAALFPFVIVPLVVEMETRLSRQSKRVLIVDSKGLLLRHYKWSHRIAWPYFRGIHVEGIPEMSSLTKLTIEYGSEKNRQTTKRWCMAIDRQADEERIRDTIRNELPDSLLANIESRGVSPLMPDKVDQGHPDVQFTRGSGIYMMGVFFLIHGLPMVFALWSGLNQKSEGSDSGYNRIQQFIVQHFESREQFRRLCLATGASASTVGAVFLTWGWRVMSKSRQPQSDSKIRTGVMEIRPMRIGQPDA
jgi:hypothetical protein